MGKYSSKVVDAGTAWAVAVASESHERAAANEARAVARERLQRLRAEFSKVRQGVSNFLISTSSLREFCSRMSWPVPGTICRRNSDGEVCDK